MLRIYTIVLLLLFSFIMSFPAHAADVDTHAPIGVMRDHTHKKGEWMVSYRYMRMDMPGNYEGADKVSVNDVHSGFMIAPIDMTMDMHMVGMMYGVSDEFTAMVMVPYVIKAMDHRRRTDSREFSTRTEGIGDVTLTGMYSLKEMLELPVQFNLGIGFPTGSINQKDDTLVGPSQNLPYPMQSGSGTYSLLPGITYFDKKDDLSWGFQEATAVQLGKNEQKYSLGDVHELTAWLSYQWEEWVSTSFRVKGSLWGNIDGADPRINANMVPTAHPDLRGGERVDLFLGINLLGHNGVFNGHRLAIEVGHPVYQNLDGPQLGAGLQGIVGWQKAW